LLKDESKELEPLMRKVDFDSKQRFIAINVGTKFLFHDLALQEFVIFKDSLFLYGFINFNGELFSMLVKSKEFILQLQNDVIFGSKS
jgi:hypothetical protein